MLKSKIAVIRPRITSRISIVRLQFFPTLSMKCIERRAPRANAGRLPRLTPRQTKSARALFTRTRAKILRGSRYYAIALVSLSMERFWIIALRAIAAMPNSNMPKVAGSGTTGSLRPA